MQPLLYYCLPRSWSAVAHSLQHREHEWIVWVPPTQLWRTWKVNQSRRPEAKQSEEESREGWGGGQRVWYTAKNINLLSMKERGKLVHYNDTYFWRISKMNCSEENFLFTVFYFYFICLHNKKNTALDKTYHICKYIQHAYTHTHTNIYIINVERLKAKLTD